MRNNKRLINVTELIANFTQEYCTALSVLDTAYENSSEEPKIPACLC